MWVIVNVYTHGMTFSQVEGAYIRLCAARDGHVLCQFKLTDSAPSNSTGLVLAKIFRNAAQRWCIMAVGKDCGGRTARDSLTQKACGVTGPMSTGQVEALREKANHRQPQLSAERVELFSPTAPLGKAPASQAQGTAREVRDLALVLPMEPRPATLGYAIGLPA